MNDKKNYAVLTLKNEMEKVKENLNRFKLKVVNIEPMTWLYASFFGIIATEEMVKEKFPYMSVLIVEGTEDQFKDYCTDSASDIASYFCN